MRKKIFPYFISFRIISFIILVSLSLTLSLTYRMYSCITRNGSIRFDSRARNKFSLFLLFCLAPYRFNITYVHPAARASIKFTHKKKNSATRCVYFRSRPPRRMTQSKFNVRRTYNARIKSVCRVSNRAAKEIRPRILAVSFNDLVSFT